MSLIEILKKKSIMETFTTPSHGQNFFIFSKFRQFYKYDISETDTHNPEMALEKAQKNAAKIYKTKSTSFLINGSTSGIIASVLSCVEAGDKVLIWDKAHPSHKNAVKLAGAETVYYELKKDDEWGIYGATSPEIVEGKIKNGTIKAVIITSPSYEGVISDVAKISKICKKYNAFLIVDEAHGALYPFCDSLPKSAIYEGADFVIQSLHKTAGGLNPTALLQCNLDINVKPALNLISTTSPSYPLLASIEKNINFLNSKKSRKNILDLINNIQEMKKELSNLDFYQGKDATKILIKNGKLNGYELSEFLYKNNIEDERTNEKSTMLLCGIGTNKKKLDRLQKILKKLV